MLINASVLNGTQLNGSSSRTSHGSASITAGAAVVAAALSVFAGSSSSHASGAIVLADINVLNVAEASIVAQSQLHIQVSAYVLKTPNISINGLASINIDAQQFHDSGTALSGTAEVIPFQGDSAHILGSATVDPDATLCMDTQAKADSCNAIIVTSVILHADGVDSITGSANVDAVPSVIFAGDTFTTHDGHTRLAGTGLLEPPDDPLHKIASIENGGFIAGAISAANSTIAHAGFSSSSCSVVVLSDPILDLYYQASILFPAADVQADAHVLRGNDDPVIINGVSVNYFTGYGMMLPSPLIDGNANIVADASNAQSAVACCASAGANVIANSRAVYSASSSINGSVDVLANLRSNPNAHAIDRRTLVMTEDSREVIIKSEDRTITMSST